MDFPRLKSTNALDFFSEYGKTIYNPTGIFYWTARSKKEARINATIGAAKGRGKDVFDDGGDEAITLCIPSIHENFPGFGTEEVFPYAPEVGVPAFRDSWKSWMLKKAGDQASRLEKHILTPMVVPGITGAISICVRMFVNAGEKIVTSDKRWENYDNVFERNVGVLAEDFPMFDGQRFNIDGFIQAIKNVWQEQDTATAVLNFPNNPTGYCPPKETAHQLVDAIHALVGSTRKKLVLLFDDAYEGFVYDQNAEMWSLFYQMIPRENFLPVKMDGVSKELLWYGARIGAVTLSVPEAWKNDSDWCNELENKFRGAVRNTVSNSSNVAQQAALKALKGVDRLMAERQKTINLLSQRYKTMRDELAKLENDILRPDPYQGGFFCFINLVPKSGLRATDVCDHLLKQYQVGTVPIEAGDINGIRIAFCSVEKEDIPELCQSLDKSVKDLSK